MTRDIFDSITFIVAQHSCSLRFQEISNPGADVRENRTKRTTLTVMLDLIQCLYKFNQGCPFCSSLMRDHPLYEVVFEVDGRRRGKNPLKTTNPHRDAKREHPNLAKRGGEAKIIREYSSRIKRDYTSTPEFERINDGKKTQKLPMTPEDKKLLDTHVKEIAKILYKNTPPEKIETFEGIETAVRDQVLEHLSPKIAFFLSEKRLEQPEDAAEP